MPLVLAGQQFNIRSARDDEIFSHNVFNSDDMNALSKVCRKMLLPGMHGHVLCSTLHFGSWYRILPREVWVQKSTGQFDSNFDRDELKKETSVFELDSIPIHYSGAGGIWKGSPTTCTPSPTNVAKDAIGIWRMGQSGAGSRVYELLSLTKVPAAFSWWKTEMIHIRQAQWK